MRSLILAAFLLANLALPDPAAAAVRLCKANVTGQPREASSEVQAKKLALDSWMAEVRKTGSNYVSWQLAINKQLSCTPSAMKTFRCQARGQPCTISQVPPPRGTLKKLGNKGLDI